LFDVGPSTGAYVEGMLPSEERPPSTFRWTRSAAALTTPLELIGGEPRLTLRCARFLDRPARIHVSLAGRPLGTFVAPPGGYRVHALRICSRKRSCRSTDRGARIVPDCRCGHGFLRLPATSG
jgi:hypothetical protein